MRPDGVEEGFGEAMVTMERGIAEICLLIRNRDQWSEEAGKRLAAAGVPVRTNVGRIRYDHVRQGVSGRPMNDHFNLWIDGEPISRRQDVGHSDREAQRAIDSAIRGALRASGFRLDGQVVSA